MRAATGSSATAATAGAAIAATSSPLYSSSAGKDAKSGNPQRASALAALPVVRGMLTPAALARQVQAAAQEQTQATKEPEKATKPEQASQPPLHWAALPVMEHEKELKAAAARQLAMARIAKKKKLADDE